ncbi:DUF7668 domain-containing protein [Micromonospora thermarum]|uniref:DUF7668 domain-containing protein n=1 Tax=Micromonospora thermarum TaxID=2720024 RepID=A0ABX0ZH74_9ACTN|nr:hypothetical protein [Micromonospora thermarum]NJP35376.1 hypothetical protein [Micromonospora thermarum]
MTAADLPARFRTIIEQVVERIAAGDFDGLARDYSRSDHDLGAWAREYPATFIPLPPEAWNHANAYSLADDDAWKVDVDLWSRENGRSDMTLQVTIWEEAGAITLTIDDLHAL